MCRRSGALQSKSCIKPLSCPVWIWSMYCTLHIYFCAAWETDVSLEYCNKPHTVYVVLYSLLVYFPGFWGFVQFICLVGWLLFWYFWSLPHYWLHFILFSCVQNISFVCSLVFETSSCLYNNPFHFYLFLIFWFIIFILISWPLSVAVEYKCPRKCAVLQILLFCFVVFFSFAFIIIFDLIKFLFNFFSQICALHFAFTTFYKSQIISFSTHYLVLLWKTIIKKVAWSVY